MPSAATQAKLTFKPRTTHSEILPDAPEGEWEFLIPKGKCQVRETQNHDPQLLVPHVLYKAIDPPENESHNNAIVTQRLIFFDDVSDPSRKKAMDMTRTRLRNLCRAIGIDYAEVYPTQIDSSESFTPLIRALEGQKGTCWTVHVANTRPGGEQTTDTEIRYDKPGAGLLVKSAEPDDDAPNELNGGIGGGIGGGENGETDHQGGKKKKHR